MLVLSLDQIRTTIVQSLSSSYAVVLGGYGPGYSELSMVEVVKHDKVCRNIISDIPPALARFLGDVSGLAEFVDNKVFSIQSWGESCKSLKSQFIFHSPILSLSWDFHICC